MSPYRNFSNIIRMAIKVNSVSGLQCKSKAQEGGGGLHSKILDAHPTLGVQVRSISCSFWQHFMLAPPGKLAPPLQGNPGSATVRGC